MGNLSVSDPENNAQMVYQNIPTHIDRLHSKTSTNVPLASHSSSKRSLSNTSTIMPS